MIAWIAGSTGYTGAHLVDRLLAASHTVHAHIRPESRSAGEKVQRWEAAGAHIARVPWEPEAQREALAKAQPDVVFSLLGITRAGAREEARASGGDAPTYTSVDLGLTLQLLEATAAAAPQARFVYLSSLGVRPNTNNAYLQARWEAEEAIRQSPLAWTIVRPSFITGPDRAESRPLERVGATLFDGLARGLAWTGFSTPFNAYSSITGAALAANLARLATDPDAAQRIVEAHALDRAPPPLQTRN